MEIGNSWSMSFGFDNYCWIKVERVEMILIIFVGHWSQEKNSSEEIEK